MRVIAWAFIALMIVGTGVVVSLAGADVVTSHYATLADARADKLLERGWLPDVLPNSAFQIRTSNDLELNSSEGKFRFTPRDYEQLSSHLYSYMAAGESGAVSADKVGKRERRGFEVGAYSEKSDIWVFFCKPTAGFCEYTMWSRGGSNELVPTG